MLNNQSIILKGDDNVLLGKELQFFEPVALEVNGGLGLPLCGTYHTL